MMASMRAIFLSLGRPVAFNKDLQVTKRLSFHKIWSGQVLNLKMMLGFFDFIVLLPRVLAHHCGFTCRTYDLWLLIQVSDGLNYVLFQKLTEFDCKLQVSATQLILRPPVKRNVCWSDQASCCQCSMLCPTVEITRLRLKILQLLWICLQEL